VLNKSIMSNSIFLFNVMPFLFTVSEKEASKEDAGLENQQA